MYMMKQEAFGNNEGDIAALRKVRGKKENIWQQ